MNDKTYAEMNVQERAQYLLDCGVIAKTDIDPDAMEFCAVPYVKGIGKLPVGCYKTDEEAIAAGVAFLNKLAKG